VSSTTVAIELLSDRIDVAAIKGGRVLSSRRIPVEFPSDPTAWVKAVHEAGDKLRPAIEEMSVRGAPARLVYRSPTQAVDLASFELRAASQACAAATLPCLESLPYSGTAALCDATVVGRDHSGPTRRWHVVVAAERVDVARTLVEMIEAAGLTFESLVPMDAAIMAKLVRRALDYKGAQHGWLHFGKHSSFFVIGGQGRVRFERSIALGVETIVRSLTRPIRLPDEEPIELDHETAKKIVHEHGIPDTDDAVLDSPPLTRAHIMPQIQPVLQRYVVELRQSLRFGLPENERDAIDITVSGPGSTVPGLSELMAWELKLKIAPDPQYANFDYRSPAGKGSELLDVMENRQFLNLLNLQPGDTANRRQIERLRRWLWSGAAVALVVIAFDAVRMSSRLSDTRREQKSLEAAAAELKSLQKTHQTLNAALTAMGEMELVIAEEIGTRPDLRAVLHELSRLAPESVRLNSMRFAREGRVMTARLYGRAAHADKQGRTELNPFIEALQGSPIFANAELKNVDVDTVGDGTGQRFEATFDIILAPDASVLPKLAADTEGGDG
jgi:Tfp pilus assembly PilM family ATPase/Tfp pilus assembly protein PilN